MVVHTCGQSLENKNLDAIEIMINTEIHEFKKHNRAADIKAYKGPDGYYVGGAVARYKLSLAAKNRNYFFSISTPFVK